MNTNVKQLRAFVAVAQAQSLAQASERLHLSQPAVSIALRNLEAQIGGQLFSRAAKRLTLTPEGQEFLPVAERLLQDWQEAFDDLDALFSKKRGKVRIASVPTLAASLLPRVIADYNRLYPNIKLSVHDILANQVAQMVREGRADFGLSVEPTGGEDLEFTPIIDDKNVVICSLDHPLLLQEVVEWQSLTDYAFIGMHRDSSSRQETDRAMRHIGKSLNILCETGQITTVSRMVASGLGISVIPSLSFHLISGNGLDFRTLVNPFLPRTLGIITRRHKPNSSAADCLIDMLKDSPKSDLFFETR